MKVLSKNSVMEFVKKTAILWVMIILILILSVISPSFFRGHNLLNIITVSYTHLTLPTILRV